MTKDTRPIAMIAAVGSNHAIGRRNELPWHIPEDFKFFKSQTLGKPIVMGRKTFQALGRPLPGRTNIVITRQEDYAPEGAIVVHTLGAAIEVAQQDAVKKEADEVMIIGGGEIYRQALPLADILYITHVDMDVPDADAFFPEFNKDEWTLTHQDARKGDGEDQPDFVFTTYEKRH